MEATVITSEVETSSVSKGMCQVSGGPPTQCVDAAPLVRALLHGVALHKAVGVPMPPGVRELATDWSAHEIPTEDSKLLLRCKGALEIF